MPQVDRVDGDYESEEVVTVFTIKMRLRLP